MGFISGAPVLIPMPDPISPLTSLGGVGVDIEVPNSVHNGSTHAVVAAGDSGTGSVDSTEASCTAGAAADGVGVPAGTGQQHAGPSDRDTGEDMREHGLCHDRRSSRVRQGVGGAHVVFPFCGRWPRVERSHR